MLKKIKFKKGFTLIEMLIYITISSLLLATIGTQLISFYNEEQKRYKEITLYNYLTNNISNKKPGIVFLRGYANPYQKNQSSQLVNNGIGIIENTQYNTNQNNYFGGYTENITLNQIKNKINDNYNPKYDINQVRTFINNYDYIGNNNNFYVEKSFFTYTTPGNLFRSCLGVIIRDNNFNIQNTKKTCFNGGLHYNRDLNGGLYYFTLFLNGEKNQDILKILLLEKNSENYF